MPPCQEGWRPPRRRWGCPPPGLRRGARGRRRRAPGGAGAGAGAGVGVSVGTRVAGVVFLVLESALDDLALAATAGALNALNALDVLVIRGQDGLQLLLEGVRLHLGVCIDHHALVLKC